MNTIIINLKLNVGDTCYIIYDNKIKKCVVHKIHVDYNTVGYIGDSVYKAYTLVSADISHLPNPNRPFTEKEIWASKEELIKYIEEL
jgi:hypothetical protein